MDWTLTEDYITSCKCGWDSVKFTDWHKVEFTEADEEDLKQKL